MTSSSAAIAQNRPARVMSDGDQYTGEPAHIALHEAEAGNRLYWVKVPRNRFDDARAAHVSGTSGRNRPGSLNRN